MSPITNNLAWSPRSVCDLYRRRWDIEVFFKQVKQTLKLGSFLGHSANAVRWQVYTALLGMCCRASWPIFRVGATVSRGSSR